MQSPGKVSFENPNRLKIQTKPNHVWFGKWFGLGIFSGRWFGLVTEFLAGVGLVWFGLGISGGQPNQTKPWGWFGLEWFGLVWNGLNTHARKS